MPVITYVDRRDTLNRLGRIGVVGDPAVGWLAVLDPLLVREWSDRQLAAAVGGATSATTLWPWPGLYPWGSQYPGTGVIPPPDVVSTPGAWGAGAWGSGPWGG